jgi:hypothetical protein
MPARRKGAGARASGPLRVREDTGGGCGTCSVARTACPCVVVDWTSSPSSHIVLGMDGPRRSRTNRRPRGVTPFKPDLHDLVLNKNEWQNDPDEAITFSDFRSWNQRGYLPHRDAPGLTQFVTFRLADCFPSELRSEWEALLRIEDNQQRARRLEAYLDEGHGRCYLY